MLASLPTTSIRENGNKPFGRELHLYFHLHRKHSIYCRKDHQQEEDESEGRTRNKINDPRKKSFHTAIDINLLIINYIKQHFMVRWGRLNRKKAGLAVAGRDVSLMCEFYLVELLRIKMID